MFTFAHGFLNGAETVETAALVLHAATYDPATYLVGDEIVSGTPTFVHTATFLVKCSDGYYHSFGEDKRVVKNGRYVSDSAVYADNGFGTLLDPLPMVVYQNSRVSLFENTDGVESGWTVIRASVTDNVVTSPENATTGHSIITTTDTGRHAIWQTHESLDGTDVVVSCFAKQNGYDYIVFRGNQIGADREVWFNLDTGAVVGTVPTGYKASIEDAGNGWHRCIASVTVTQTGTVYTNFLPAETLNTSNFAGDGVSGMYIWCPMLETDQTEVGLPMINTSTGSVATDEIINTYPSANWSNSEGPVYLIHDYKGIDEDIILNDGVAILYVTSDVLYLDDGTNTASIAYATEGEHEIGIALDSSGGKMKVNVDGTYSTEANYDGSFGTGDITFEGDHSEYKRKDETSYTAQQTILDGWMP